MPQTTVTRTLHRTSIITVKRKWLATMCFFTVGFLLIHLFVYHFDSLSMSIAFRKEIPTSNKKAISPSNKTAILTANKSTGVGHSRKPWWKLSTIERIIVLKHQEVKNSVAQKSLGNLREHPFRDHSAKKHKNWQMKVAVGFTSSSKLGKNEMKFKTATASKGNQVENGDYGVHVNIDYDMKNMKDKKWGANIENKLDVMVGYLNGPRHRSPPQFVNYLTKKVDRFVENNSEELPTKYRIKGKPIGTDTKKPICKHHKCKRKQKKSKKLGKEYMKNIHKKKTETLRKLKINRAVKEHGIAMKRNENGIDGKMNRETGGRYYEKENEKHAIILIRKQHLKHNAEKEIMEKGSLVFVKANAKQTAIQNCSKSADDNQTDKKQGGKLNQTKLSTVYYHPDAGYEIFGQKEIHLAKDVVTFLRDMQMAIEEKKKLENVGRISDKISQNTANLKSLETGDRLDEVLRSFDAVKHKHRVYKRSVEVEEEGTDEEQRENIVDENEDDLRVLVKRGDVAKNVAIKSEKNKKTDFVNEQVNEKVQKDVKDLTKGDVKKRSDKTKLVDDVKKKADKFVSADAADKSKRTADVNSKVKVTRNTDDYDDSENSQRMIVTGDEQVESQADEEEEQEEEQEEAEEEDKDVQEERRVKRYRPRRFYIDVEDSDGRRGKRNQAAGDTAKRSSKKYKHGNRRRRYYYDDDDYRPKRHHDDGDSELKEGYSRGRREDDYADTENEDDEMRDKQKQGAEFEEEEQGEEKEQEEEEEEEDVDFKRDKEKMSEREIEDVDEKTDLAKRSASQVKANNDMEVISVDETAEKEKKRVVENAEDVDKDRRDSPDKLKSAEVEKTEVEDKERQGKTRRLIGDEKTNIVNANEKKLAKISKKKEIVARKKVQEVVEEAHASEKRDAEESQDLEDLDSYFSERQRRRYIRSLINNPQHSDAAAQGPQHSDAFAQKPQPDALAQKPQHSDAVAQKPQHPDALAQKFQHLDALAQSPQHPDAVDQNISIENIHQFPEAQHKGEASESHVK